MAQRCMFRTATGTRCPHKAHGRVGQLVFCRRCISQITGLPEKEMRRPKWIALTSDGHHVGEARWEPWHSIQERA